MPHTLLWLQADSEMESHEDLFKTESTGERKSYTSICSSGGLDPQNAAEQPISSHVSRSVSEQGVCNHSNFIL